jgi:hypothetical protein
MRKTTLLAIATAALAVVTVVTDLVRADMGPLHSTVTAQPAVQVQTVVGLKTHPFDAI